MDERRYGEQQGQSVIIVALALGVLLLFVAIAVDMSNAYAYRRQAQNAADAAALAGAIELGDYFNGYSGGDADIRLEIVSYAQQNRMLDTDGNASNGVNDNVIACYVDSTGDCIDGLPVADSTVRVGTLGYVPDEAMGVEVIVYTTAPTFFGAVLSIDGYDLRAVAASRHRAACTGGDCVLPVALHETVFENELPTFQVGQCYNLYDGGGTGNFGWVNWANQGLSCQLLDAPGVANCWEDGVYGECCTECLAANLDPLYCTRVSDVLQIGSQVYGTVGVINANAVRGLLSQYAIDGSTVHLLVYGDGEHPATEGTGCGSDAHPTGLKYNVVGFAAFRITGFLLSQGNGVKCDMRVDANGEPIGLDCDGATGDYLAHPDDCLDFPGAEECGEDCDWETGEYNRITAIARPAFDGEGGHCDAIGNLYAPPITK